MSPTRLLCFIVFCALTSACAGSGGKTATSAASDRRLSPDRSLFALVEYSEDGETLEYPGTPAVVDADINSTVRIVLDHHAISSVDVSDPELVAALDRLSALQQSYSDAVVADRQRHVDALNAYRANKPLSADEIKKKNEELNQSGKGLYKAFLQLDKYILETKGNDRVKADEFISALELTSNTNNALAYIAREHRRLQSQVGKSGLSIELSAWIDDQQLHLPGYDNLAPGPARPVDKRSFRFGAAFQAELQAAQELAASASKQSDFREQVLGILRSSLEDIIAQARTTVTAWQKDGEQTFKSLGTLALPAGVTLQHTDELFRKARAATDTCGKGVTQIQEILQEMQRALATADAKAALPWLLPKLQNAYTTVKGCATSAGEVARLAEDAAKEVKAAAAKKGTAVKKKLDKVATKITDAQSKITGFAHDVLGLRMVAQVANEVPPELATVRKTAYLAPDTELSLVRAERKDGDIVTVRAQVFDAQDRVVAETIRHIKVRTRGWVASVGASVMWVHVNGQSTSGARFQPSAGAYGVFRYRGGRDSREARTGAGAVFEPGFGVAVLAVPRQDGATHMAWMATMHLFNDIVQLGAGVNLDGSFVMGFGLGLQKLVGFGKTFD